MPKVSIVLPTYNGEKYIKESIDSVINQTFKDWELIIVNDCSTDNTPQIVEQYLKKDKRIRVIHNLKNKKLPCSLNIGFAEAKGEYFTWTSDDNCYLPDAIEKMMEYLEEEKSTYMVCAGMDIIDETGLYMYRYKKYDDIDMFYSDGVGACFMYKREVVDTIGGYDEKKFCVEDYAYWLKIIKKFGKIGWIDEVLYKYRVHENNLTATKKEYIRQQLSELRMENADFILDNLKDNPNLIIDIYCEFEKKEYKYKFLMRAQQYRPEFKIICSYTELPNNIVVWGAGNWGHRALHIFGNKIKAFADKNAKLIGTDIEGIPIISVEEMLIDSERYTICVAVSSEKVYEILKELCNSKIEKCLWIYDYLQNGIV